MDPWESCGPYRYLFSTWGGPHTPITSCIASCCVWNTLAFPSEAPWPVQAIHSPYHFWSMHWASASKCYEGLGFCFCMRSDVNMQ